MCTKYMTNIYINYKNKIQNQISSELNIIQLNKNSIKKEQKKNFETFLKLHFFTLINNLKEAKF